MSDFESLFSLLSDIGGFGWFWLGGLRWKIILMLVRMKNPFLFLHFSYNTLIIFLMMLFVKLIYAGNTTLLSKCNRAYLWKHLELASEVESDLRDTVEFGWKWVVDVSAGKSQLVFFDGSNNCGAIGVKIVILSVLKNHFLKWLCSMFIRTDWTGWTSLFS